MHHSEARNGTRMRGPERRRGTPGRRDFLQFLCCAGSARLLGAAASTGPILLENVAPGNGLDFVLRNDAAGRKYQVETVLGGLGVIDFDGDGWPGLYCVNGAS